MTRRMIWAIVAVSCLGFEARGGSTIVKIADTSGNFSGFAFAPSINNSGRVAFLASLDGGGSGVFTGNGSAVQTIATTGAVFDQFFGVQPAINDSGRVAFLASQVAPASVTGIFVGTGGAAIAVATSNDFVNFNDYLSMNAAGQVAFRAFQLSTSQEGIFLGSGGAVTTIADTSGIFSGFKPDSLFGDPSVSAGGSVAFAAQLKAGGSGFFVGNGGAATTIATTTGGSGFINLPGSPSINDAGTVVFRGDQPGIAGIYTGDGGATTTIVDSSGPFAGFGNFPAINNQGQVAFLGIPDSGPFQGGIYAGSDPVDDKVIAVGDALDGSIVTSLSFYRAFNDGSQLAFRADLADGRVGIFRADLRLNAIPEPSSLVLLGVGCLVAMGLRYRGRLRRDR